MDILIVLSFSSSHPQDWIQWSDASGVPSGQMPRGHEASNQPLYIIRASANGDLMPGKFNSVLKNAWISYSGFENRVSKFEFFVAKNVIWIPASNGVIPSNAVPGGETAGGETLYIGRSLENQSSIVGQIIPGKVHPSQKCLYVSFNSKEIKLTSYEQLVYV